MNPNSVASAVQGVSKFMAKSAFHKGLAAGFLGGLPVGYLLGRSNVSMSEIATGGLLLAGVAGALANPEEEPIAKKGKKIAEINAPPQ